MTEKEFVKRVAKNWEETRIVCRVMKRSFDSEFRGDPKQFQTYKLPSIDEYLSNNNMWEYANLPTSTLYTYGKA